MVTKKSTFLLFLGSVGLIIAAIVFTSLVNFNSDPQKNTDVRARAAQVGLVNFTGRISQYDETNSLVVVDNLAFTDTQGKSLGTWQVTYPATFVPAKFPAGTTIKITAKPTMFDISAKTLIAAEITR
jgi:hypothetical protein